MLPPAVLGGLWLLIHRHRAWLGTEDLSRRGSLVLAFLVLQSIVAVWSELASVGHHFTTGVVVTGWWVVALGLVAAGARELRARPLPGFREGVAGAFTGGGAKLGLAAVGGVAWLAVLAAIGWLYPPSNGDSIVYHLTRVAHWVQDRSVWHYATHYLHQIELAPLHEYNMAHLHLLTGSDRLDGYVQLVAAVVAIAGASEVARLLGGSRDAQLAAAVLVATLPSVILEATSTQNNDFAAAVAVAVLILLLIWRPASSPAPTAALMGLALGAAFMAKGTLVAFLAPICLILGARALVGEIRRWDGGTLVRRLAAAGGTVLAATALVAGPFLFRNVVVVGGPMGPSSRVTISTDLTPRAAAANVVRSAAGNFAIGDGRTGLRSWVSRVVLGSSRRVFEAFGVAGDDQRYALGTELDAFQTKDYTAWERSEDVGANPWHASLIVAAGGVLVAGASRRGGGQRLPLVVAVGLTAGFLLFAGTGRWSIFAVRYYVPLLVAWCPLIALALTRLPAWASGTLLVLLAAASLSPLLASASRPVLDARWRFDSPLEPYFAGAEQPVTGASAYGGPAEFEALAAAVAGTSCDRLGIANWVLLEYAVWAGLRYEGWSGRVEAVRVQNESKVLEPRGYDPCALLLQVDHDHVTPDDGWANLRFGPLALSAPPELMTGVEAAAPGFRSDVPGVAVRPGGGWVLGAARPAVARPATLFVSSDAARSLRLRLLDPSGEPTVAQVERSGAARPLAPVPTATGWEVDVAVPPGTTRLLVAARTPSADGAPLGLLGVSVAAG